ncbi:hypothetical protein BKA69DRAFT_290225 [Paraphysoderma sedebokerense]|nr:hypothetical protein BKA69DRAFT_290225 [Paraphysoderma sedebokerense]
MIAPSPYMYPVYPNMQQMPAYSHSQPNMMNSNAGGALGMNSERNGAMRAPVVNIPQNYESSKTSKGSVKATLQQKLKQRIIAKHQNMPSHMPIYGNPRPMEPTYQQYPQQQFMGPPQYYTPQYVPVAQPNYSMMSQQLNHTYQGIPQQQFQNSASQINAYSQASVVQAEISPTRIQNLSLQTQVVQQTQSAPNISSYSNPVNGSSSHSQLHVPTNQSNQMDQTAIRDIDNIVDLIASTDKSAETTNTSTSPNKGEKRVARVQGDDSHVNGHAETRDVEEDCLEPAAKRQKRTAPKKEIPSPKKTGPAAVSASRPSFLRKVKKTGSPTHSNPSSPPSSESASTPAATSDVDSKRNGKTTASKTVPKPIVIPSNTSESPKDPNFSPTLPNVPAPNFAESSSASPTHNGPFNLKFQDRMLSSPTRSHRLPSISAIDTGLGPLDGNLSLNTSSLILSEANKRRPNGLSNLKIEIPSETNPSSLFPPLSSFLKPSANPWTGEEL